MNSCEWPACLSLYTHTVRIHLPDLPDEMWLVCRQHDRVLKIQAVRSRPKKPPVVDEPIPNVVRCAGCGRVLEERSDVAVHERRPCPDCRSSARNIEVHLSDALALHGKVQAKVRRSGKRGWALDTTGGDDYTRDLEAWGQRAQTNLGREGNGLYREVIEFWDGTRIESTARLSDHHD